MLSTLGARLVKLTSSTYLATACHRQSRGYQSSQRDPSKISHVKPTRIVDLRSDVLSKPTPEMFSAMVDSNVSYGEDIFGENTTINDLEARCAKMLGKEAGLFVTSCTMSNLLVMLTYAREVGSEVIVGDKSHILLHEYGMANIARMHSRTARTRSDGTLCLEDCRALMRMPIEIPHCPRTRALCLENSHSYIGGKVLPVEYFAEARQFCDEFGIKLFLDGSRLWNAAVAANVEPIEYAKYADAVTFSLSKSLNSPIGGCIVSDAETIEMCRRYRQVIGGGARQLGMLAAVANRAFDGDYRASLRNDHENMKTIYSDIARLKLPSWLVLDEPQTNICLLHVTPESPMNIDDLQAIIEEPTEECPVRLKTLAVSAATIRMVTHNDVSREDCEWVGKKIEAVLHRLK